jgi:hypothetical protein
MLASVHITSYPGEKHMKLRAFVAIVGIGIFSAALAPVHSVVATPATIIMPSGPIHSKADLQRYLSTAGSDSPLNRLSVTSRRAFLSSLRFNSAGITTFRYDGLQRELTASQAYRVLALFGFANDIALIPHLRIVTSEDRRLWNEAVAASKP